MKIRPRLASTCFAITWLTVPNVYAQDAEVMSAIVKASNTAVLSAQIDGLIQNVHVKEGQPFKKDDMLLSLDCTVQKNTLQKSRAHFEFIKKENSNIKKLAKLNSASQLQIAQSGTELIKAKTDLDSARYQVTLCDVHAPYNGSVTRVWVNAHENVQAKSKVLEIVDNDVLDTEFLAPSNMLPSLQSGLEFKLNINETNKTYIAVIERVIPTVDAVSQTVKVIGKLRSAHPELWSGMSGTVILQ